ncbi:MAG: hypothetical protein Q9227_004601 [Pyrenula ochraceoflavens]
MTRCAAVPHFGPQISDVEQHFLQYHCDHLFKDVTDIDRERIPLCDGSGYIDVTDIDRIPLCDGTSDVMQDWFRHHMEFMQHDLASISYELNSFDNSDCTDAPQASSQDHWDFPRKNEAKEKRTTKAKQITSALREALQEKENAAQFQKLMDAARVQQRSWNKLSSCQKSQVEVQILSCQEKRLTLHSNLKRMRQWTALRLVRTAFNGYYRKLLSIAMESQSMAFNHLKWHTLPSEMLQLAALTLKDALTGSAPTSLEEVLSFIMLSFSLAEMMRQIGRAVSFEPCENDFRAWRECLQNEADRLAFDEVVHELWPRYVSEDISLSWMTGRACSTEAQEYEGAINLLPQRMFNLDQLPFKLPDLECPVSDSSPEISQTTDPPIDDVLLHASGPDFVPEIFDPVKGLLNDISDNDLDFSAFLDLQFSTTGTGPQPEIQRPNDFQTRPDIVQTTWNRADALTERKGRDAQANATPCSAKQQYYNPNYESSPASSNAHNYMPSITGALIFSKALEFLAYLFQLGPLLLYLIGGQVSTSRDCFKQSSQEKLRSAKLTEDIKFRIINPLRLDTRFEDLIPVVKVATRFVELGWQFTSCHELFRQFTQEVLSLCLRASHDIDFDHVYGYRSHTTAKYNHQYVKAKFASETADFNPASPQPERSPAENLSNPTEDITSFLETPLSPQTLAPQQTDLTSPVANPSSLFNPPSDPPASTLSPNSTRLSTPIPRACSTCNKTYTGGDSLSNLRRHQREAHEGKTLRCPYQGCRSVSPRKDNLRNHWLRRHRGVEMPKWLRRDRR